MSFMFYKSRSEIESSKQDQTLNEIDILLMQLSVLNKKYSLPHSLQTSVKEDSLRVLNESLSSTLIHYLCKIIDEKKSVEFLPWPLFDNKLKSQFRVGVKKFITWLNKEMPNVHVPTVLPSTLMSPGSQKCVMFIFKLTIFTVKLHCRRDLGVYGLPDIAHLVVPSERIKIFWAKLYRASVLLASKKLIHQRIDDENMKRLKRLQKENHLLTFGLEKANNKISQLSQDCPVAFRARINCQNLDDCWDTVVEWGGMLMNQPHKKDSSTISMVKAALEDLINALQTINSKSGIDGNKIITNFDRGPASTFAKQNRVVLYEEGKLSLPGIIATGNIMLKKMLLLINNCQDVGVDNVRTTVLSSTTDITLVISRLKECYRQKDIQINDVSNNCIKLQNEIDKIGETIPNRFSGLFDSPVICFGIQNNQVNLHLATTPGNDGFKLLEEFKKDHKLMKRNHNKSSNFYMGEDTCSSAIPIRVLKEKTDSKNILGNKFLNGAIIENSLKSIEHLIDLDTPVKNMRHLIDNVKVTNYSNENLLIKEIPLAKSVSQNKSLINEKIKAVSNKERSRIPLRDKSSKIPLYSSSPLSGMYDGHDVTKDGNKLNSKFLNETSHNTSISDILESISLEETPELLNDSSIVTDSESFGNPTALPTMSERKKRHSELFPTKRSGRPSLDNLIERYKKLRSRIVLNEH